MAAKGESAVNGGKPVEAPVEIAPKPEGIPDKFYNAETGVVDYQALAKSYVELEKTKGKPAETPKDAPAKTTEEAATTDVDTAKDAVEAAGVDVQELSKEYAEKGELTPESYAKLAKAGFGADVVDAFIAGQNAQVQLAQTQAHSITEGADGYAAMVAYAQANLTPEEISAYNKAVNSRDAATRELAVRGMWTRYSAESGNGSDKLITNKTNSKVGDSAYASRAEMMADMKDPKYKSDPAFRAKVEAKLARSDIF
jgi:hypothetical protein